MFKPVRNELRFGSSIVALLATVSAASAQTVQTTAAPSQGGTTLPDITMRAPAQDAPKKKPRRTEDRPATELREVPPPLTPTQLEVRANEQVVRQTSVLDARRDDILQPKTGTTITTLGQRDLENIPGGSNVSVNDLVYQLPGVTQDSTSSGDFHVRNDHANVQYRINGIQMPDGVSGFSQFLEAGLFQNFSLITGALPAQYGLHTTGILDITTKSGSALSGGNVSVYGGSFGTITPSFEYGGVKGNTEYFVTGRYFGSDLGLENPTSSLNATHDHTSLERFFSYTSTLIDPETRFVTFAGVSNQAYQIPTNPGQTPTLGSALGVNASSYPSSIINENQYETNSFFVAALQRSMGDVDAQISYYNRYSELHFVPDPVGDLLYNGVDTDVLRRSFVNGFQGDFSYRVNDVHVLRTGFIAQGEQTTTATVSTVYPNSQVNPIDSTTTGLPENISDASNKFGWQVGAYIQDEWKLTPTLTLNTGLRFDQIWQYVNANQFSPRVSLQWQPWWSTVMHAGYARYFTPPDQVLGYVPQPQLLNNTTGAVSGTNTGSILPERSDVFDVGIVQQMLPKCETGAGGANCPALEVGVDAYYKWARDLLDDGQFGQAYLLSAFNYDKGIVEGVEFKAKYTQGNFTFYTNWAMGWEKATDPVSNQSFFGDDLGYLQSHWVYTDHTQLLTGSAGASYLFTGTDYSWLNDSRVSATMIYGSGLRADGTLPNGDNCPNCSHVPAYTQVNLGLSKEFKDSGWDPKPFTLRFDIVNLFDQSYQIRDGSGIGVFAPQYGPRRGFFFGFSQKL